MTKTQNNTFIQTGILSEEDKETIRLCNGKYLNWLNCTIVSALVAKFLITGNKDDLKNTHMTVPPADLNNLYYKKELIFEAKNKIKIGYMGNTNSIVIEEALKEAGKGSHAIISGGLVNTWIPRGHAMNALNNNQEIIIVDGYSNSYYSFAEKNGYDKTIKQYNSLEAVIFYKEDIKHKDIKPLLEKW